MMALAKWANTPTLDDLKADYRGALDAHTKNEANVDRWLSNMRGDQIIKSKAGRSKVVPKLIRKQAEWRYPSLSEPFLSTNDLFSASPRTFEDKKSADQNAQILNYQFTHQINKVKFIDEYVRTVTDEGTVVVKVGWDFEEEEREVDYKFKDGSVITETEMVTVKNQPTVEICRHDNVVIDPTCDGDFKKAQFGIHSFETCLSELRQDGRYSNLDKIDIGLGADYYSDYDVEDSTFTFNDDARKRFVVREYHGFWDYDGDGIAKQFICTWAGNEIIRLEESPYPFKGIPFVGIQYLPVRKSNFGEPDGELLEDNQKIVGAVTRGMIDLMARSANGQMGTQKGVLDTVNARKFERGEDYQYNVGADPRTAFQMGKYPEIPRSAMEMITLQNNEAESITGIKAFNHGISGNALGDSVGGIRTAMDATAKREMGILRRLANGMVEIGNMVMKMNQEWLSDREIIRIANEPVAILREDLAGEYDITLNISTPEAKAEKAAGLEYMLQTAGNTMPFEFKQMILADIAKLKNQPELAMRIESYKPEPDQAAQEKAMLETELLKAQIFNEQNKGLENQVDVDLKRAKIATEQAKARHFNSGADQKDLKFIEDESGTTQARKLQMQDNHSKNINEQKIVDSMVLDEQSAGSLPTNGI